MLLMFERRIRGGITQVVHWYSMVNNPYMSDKFNPDESTYYLQYLDANNLYGWAMSQSLPTGGFRWVSIEPNEVGELVKHTEKGYLLEVNAAYPDQLHDLHNDLPFMCGCMALSHVEKLVPTYMVSEIMLSTFEH